MAGTYYITEDKSDSYKFRCMVQFNGKTAEYYEIDLSDPSEIDSILQTTADNDAIKIAESKNAISVTIADGIIVK